MLRFSAEPSTRPMVAKVCHLGAQQLESPPQLLVLTFRAKYRSFVSGRPESLEGMNLGKDMGEARSPLKQFVVDLKLKARDEKLDLVNGHDLVCEYTRSRSGIFVLVLLYLTFHNF